MKLNLSPPNEERFFIPKLSAGVSLSPRAGRGWGEGAFPLG
jgi:hypothetical protein